MCNDLISPSKEATMPVNVYIPTPFRHFAGNRQT